mmetsp:Transcript_14626/g.31646  ORF Transcript_14626/g.31646 Transcript_14626/m.31646 type:complete len:88 (-) Transcript_14626:219-482(-)
MPAVAKETNPEMNAWPAPTQFPIGMSPQFATELDNQFAANNKPVKDCITGTAHSMGCLSLFKWHNLIFFRHVDLWSFAEHCHLLVQE